MAIRDNGRAIAENNKMLCKSQFMYVIEDYKKCRFIEKGLCNKSALIIYCECVAEKNFDFYKKS